MTFSMEITRREYAIDIPIDDFRHLAKADTLRWYGPSLDECDFNHLDGVHTLEYNGHFGANVFVTIDDEYDTPELHKKIIEIITNRIADIKQARIDLVAEIVEELADAFGTDDWKYIRDGLLHRMLAEFGKFDAIEFRKKFVDDCGFSMNDKCMQCERMTNLVETFKEEWADG